MPRTSDWFLDCVFYIYDSEVAANENDERAGGSGFLVAKRGQDNPSIFKIFGVTAAHVIRKSKTPFLRFNKRFESGVLVLEVPRSKWTQHPDGAAKTPFGESCSGVLQGTSCTPWSESNDRHYIPKQQHNLTGRLKFVYCLFLRRYARI